MEIKNNPGEPGSKMVTIYVPLFRVGYPEEFLMFNTMIQKVVKDQGIFTGTQKYGMTHNIMLVEVLWVFEQNSQERGTEINNNY